MGHSKGVADGGILGATGAGVASAASTYVGTLLYFGPDGRLLGKHRKLMPTNHERLIHGLGDGSTLRVYDTPQGRIGGLICWENWMPLPRAVLYGLGEDLHVAILDAVVDHLDVVTGAPIPHPLATGYAFHLSRDGLKQRLHQGPGLGAPGEKEGARGEAELGILRAEGLGHASPSDRRQHGRDLAPLLALLEFGGELENPTRREEAASTGALLPQGRGRSIRRRLEVRHRPSDP